ncbi:MAG TPA: hypothetical protein VM577_20585 [Anaerovoracaceae bacterium]|nr:hypothetical protein [Anaerovoracaceae bacterium]
MPEHDCDLQSYYSVNITHEPEYSYNVIIHDIRGKEIYNKTSSKELRVEYIGDCVLSVSLSTGTMETIVDYVDIHTGKTAKYENPILAGHGVVCLVVPNVDKTKLRYEIHPMFEPEKMLKEGEFEAAIWIIPHSAITNASFSGEYVILLTYVLPDEESEKTMQIFLW